MALEPRGGNTFRLSFRSPGDDGFCGTAERYVADVDGEAVDLGEPVDGRRDLHAATSSCAPGARVTVRAEDEAPNLGPPGSARGAGAAVGPAAARATAGRRRRRPGRGPGSRPCIPRRARVTAGRVGPARIGRSLRALQRRYRVTRRSRGTVRFCVRGGGRFLVRAERGGSTSWRPRHERHRTRQARPGSRAAARANTRGHGGSGAACSWARTRRRGRVVYGTRAGRVRFLAVVSRAQARRPAALARRLRALGLR